MASVDGLISGLNTTDIVAQLMQLERQPQARIQSKQTQVESAIGALRNLNTKIRSIATAATALADPAKWQPATAASSDATKVAVTATAGAAQGTLSVNVTRLATAGSFLRVGTATALTGDGSTVAAANSTLHLKKGDAPAVQIATGDGSLSAVMRAINASDAGVTATAVQLTSGQYSLKLDSKTTGLGTGITVGLTDGADDGFTTALGPRQTLVQPQDAELRIGSQTVSRTSNTISDLLPGVTLTLLKADATTSDPATTISVQTDTDKVAGQVAALVDAVNAATSDIKAVTGYNVEAGNKGKLYGDAGVRALRDRLIGSIAGAGTSIAGVSIDRNGVASFDKSTFLKALAADPAQVQRVLGTGTPEVAAAPPAAAVPASPGLAGRLKEVAEAASRARSSTSSGGLLVSGIESRETQVSRLKSDVADWENRLTLRETSLKRQYAALETALGASQSQGQWLSGQLASLPRWGS